MKDDPEISIIIPARNAERELGLCLNAIFSSSKKSEVIVVDDASVDKTVSIASSYPCRIIKLQKQRGPAAARNIGAKEASANIILFIDSDIIVNDETISSITDAFQRDNSISACVGILCENAFYKNLTSQFFNLRKHYDYLLINNRLTTLYTSVTAIKKDIFLSFGGFNERYRDASCEDAELGRRLFIRGYRIVLNKRAKVTHLKRHTLKTLLKSDYYRACHFLKIIVREGLAGNVLNERKFGSFRTSSLLTVCICPAMVFTSFIFFFSFSKGMVFFSALLCIFVISNARFIIFASRFLGWRKTLFMPILIFIDSLIIFCGILYGFFSFLIGDRF